MSEGLIEKTVRRTASPGVPDLRLLALESAPLPTDRLSGAGGCQVWPNA
jgi:hypothetical protein